LRSAGCPRSLVRRGGGIWESTNPHGLGAFPKFHYELTKLAGVKPLFSAHFFAGILVGAA
jgi:hypothetical protein